MTDDIRNRITDYTPASAVTGLMAFLVSEQTGGNFETRSTKYVLTPQILSYIQALITVTTINYTDESITTPKLAPNLTGIGVKLPDGELTTRHYGDGSITTPKLADQLITEGKYAPASIPATAFKADAIGESVAKFNANKLQGVAITTQAPTIGQTLVFDGTEYGLEPLVSPAYRVFETTAELLAFIPDMPNQGAIALENNGVYIWDAVEEEWNLSENADFGATLTAIANDVAQAEIDIDALQASDTANSAIIDGFELSIHENWQASDGRLYRFAIVSNNNQLVFGIDNDGGVNVGFIAIDQTDTSLGQLAMLRNGLGQVFGWLAADGEATLHNIGLKTITNDIYKILILTGLGQIIASVDYDGQVFINGLTAGTTPQPSARPALSVNAHRTVDVIGGFLHGQSNAGTGVGTPALSTTQPYDNIKMNGSLLTINNSTTRTNFEPLVEATRETPTSAMLNSLTERLGGEAFTATQFLGLSGSHGGRRIDELNKGATRYEAYLGDIASASQIANAAGLSFSVGWQLWVQGEADYNAQTSRHDYYAQLVELASDFADDVAAITNQRFAPILLNAQVAASRSYINSNKRPLIALAQWRATQANPLIKHAASLYHIPHIGDDGIATDKVHISALGANVLGHYGGLAAYLHLYEKQSIQPLEPLRYELGSGFVDVVFNVPVGELSFDTTQVADTFNKGFDVFTHDLALREIVTGATIVDRDRVRLALSSALNKGDRITYAWGRDSQNNFSEATLNVGKAGPVYGPRGNLRDQRGDYYTATVGETTYRLDNWCVVSELTI